MSELKRFYTTEEDGVIYDEYGPYYDADLVEYVLAEKDKQLRHYKYHKCLDKAKICQLHLERYEQYVTKYKNCDGPTIKRWRFLKDHYEKWYKNWLKIAEKLGGDEVIE